MPLEGMQWSGQREAALASAARTTNGETAALTGYGAIANLRAQLNVAAAAGAAPTLNVLIEDSVDGGVTWNTIGTFTQRTAAGREVINITSLFGDVVRVSYTIGGATPSFTFAVDWVAQGVGG